MATKKPVASKAAASKPMMSDTQKIGLGVGLTAAAVAAASTYFLYGSASASKNRKVVKSWALKAKAEVLEGLEKAQAMTQNEYEQLIDTVGGAYMGLKSASKADIVGFKKEMKDHWNKIAKTATPQKKATKKAVKKASTPVKTAVKKAAAKAK